MHTNQFVFSDLESYALSVTVNPSDYSPQAKVDKEETKQVNYGESIILTSTALTSTNNSYQWYKDGQLIAGATTKGYTISNAKDTDAGVYHFLATNSIVTSLTLERNPIDLVVNGDSTDCDPPYIAIIVDESGSIYGDEITQIKAGLKAFIAAEENSEMTISLIGMSNQDTNIRTDAILEKKITADTKVEFDTWIDNYRNRGVGRQSDFWASGFQVVLNSLSTTPDIVIVITDGSQVNSTTVLKQRMAAINASSHLYVYGIHNGSYVNSSFTEQSVALSEYLNLENDIESENFSKSTPASAIIKQQENLADRLKESLTFLLDRAPISSNTNLLEADYYSYTTFEDLGDGFSSLSAELIISGVSCNANSFCTSQMEKEYPTIADLTPSGANINWYLEETGGSPLDVNEELTENEEENAGEVYWWDDTTDSITARTKITAYIDLGTLDEDLYDYQAFSISENATIADLEPNGGTIEWYATGQGTTYLEAITPLENGIYYVEDTTGSSCRLAVYVFIGTFPPTGDGVQYLCEGSTLTDIAIQTQDATSNILWYATETEGTLLPITTALENRTTYYAAQIDAAGNESIERRAVTIFLIQVAPPEIPFAVQEFYSNPIGDQPRVSDLLAIGIGIKWFTTLTGGTSLPPEDLLVNPDGRTYYAQQTLNGCVSTRAGVTIKILEQTGPNLLGCEKFKPNPGQDYIINGWVREQAVKNVNPQRQQFNTDENKKLFAELLNHLKDLITSKDRDLLDIPAEYIPTSSTEDLNFDPLLKFVKNTTVPEKQGRLIVYDFTRIKDDYGGTRPGEGRTIGFKFWLNKADRGKDLVNKIEYKSPFVQYRFFGRTKNRTYRYPLLDQQGEEQTLTFKGVSVEGDYFIITSDFKAEGPPRNRNFDEPYPQPTSPIPSAIHREITTFDFEEVKDYQPMNYVNTMVELEYKNVEREVINLEDKYIEFKPQGAIIDGWQRVTAEFTIPSLAAQMTIRLANKTIDNSYGAEGKNAGSLAYFDDIRMQPYDSSMKTFVYDPITQRLMSELDENNYATFYEYDAEGGLIRVKKETAKGIYTIQETRSSTTKKQ
jgi:hypothetical protein